VIPLVILGNEIFPLTEPEGCGAFEVVVVVVVNL